MRAIMACDPAGGIGYKNKLPWSKLIGDLSRFKQLTQNNTVLMGSATWNSLSIKPLPNRTNIVFSRENFSAPKNVIIINDLDQIRNYTQVWFIGGGRLLEYVWPYITEFHLTRAKEIYSCDTFINLLYLNQNFVKFTETDNVDNVYEIWHRK
jgi:dihydrofolate reductase